MVERAKEILREMLAWGPIDYTRIIDAMCFERISRKDYRDAKKALGVVSFSASRDGEHLMTLWALPDKLEAVAYERNCD